MSAFSHETEDKLFKLLPAILQERDAEAGFPLRALLSIIEEQAEALEADISQLGSNAFIETCEPWAIPYIGALVGTGLLSGDNRVQDAATAEALFEDLEGPSFVPPVGLRSRTDTMKTVYYRRRKSTLPMLEELARDVTGWAAHAVEFFERLVWAQWVRNRLRTHALATPDVRSVERMDRIDGPFDETCHTVDVRPPGGFEGWENIPNIGFFLWRLGALELPRVSARRRGPAGDFRYHFSVLGNDVPLFSRLRREGDEAGLATELHVPQAIRPARFFDDLSSYLDLPLPRPGFTAFYGAPAGMGGLPPAPEASLFIAIDGAPVPPDDIRCRQLDDWTQPEPNQVAIDVRTGRLTLGSDRVPAGTVEVWSFQGWPGDTGGGSYPRTAWLMSEDVSAARLIVDASGDPGTFPTIGAALTHWVAGGRDDTIIRIRDNRTYAENITINIDGANGRFLAIEAEDGFRPHLRPDTAIRVQGINEDFALTLGGLLVEGVVEIPGSLGRLRLIHTTMVPGRTVAEPDPAAPPPASPPPPSVRASAIVGGEPANSELRVEMAFSITGQLRIPATAEGIFAIDSAIDGTSAAAIRGPGVATSPGPPLHLERCTLRGEVHARQINLATEVIFNGPVEVERQQIGCIRFSYVEPVSRTPRRYRCQPDLTERAEITSGEVAAGGPLSDTERQTIRDRVRMRVRPEYTSEHYGDPGYLQLALLGPEEIATGAEDGSEMGVWSHLKQPQREANLRMRLEEYLPFGLDPGIIYVT